MSIETMTKLATVTVGAGGSSSVSFSSIPQTYTDLSLLISSRNTNNDGSDNMLISLNGSSSNFSGRYLFTNTNGTLNSGTDTTPAGAYNGGNTTASTFSNVSVYFPNYTSANYKSFSVDSVAENNGTQSNLYFDAKLWSSTEAITSMSFTCTSGNFAQHTTFTLYGIRNARRTAGNSIKATGGNISFDGTYVVHTFNTSGTFTPTSTLVADYLVAAGGGGGGGNDGNVDRMGGGGGAGGLRSTVTATGGGGNLESALSLTPGTTYTITVGAGGAGGPVVANNVGGADGSDGTNSSISGTGITTVTSTGGGGGGQSRGSNGRSGGSGGGGGDNNNNNGGAGTTNQGYAGGTGSGGVGYGGGGGGAGGIGTSANASGTGGSGVATSITGSSVTYAVGGTAGQGTRTNGTANTGNGGSGSRGGSGAGNAGGSGIVIIRYKA